MRGAAENMINIIACDDDKDIVRALKIYLSSEGFNVLEAYNGRQVLELLAENDVQLVLMDVMMPQMDGIEATAEIRKKYNVPVILITAKSEDYDKILGLDVGADDYITKPFNPVEVVARAKSQLRRYLKLGKAPVGQHLRNGGLLIDDVSKKVLVDGEEVSFTPTEYSILKLFMENIDSVLSPREIYKRVWNGSAFGGENTVIVHIRHIREKIEIDPASPHYIVAVYGHGYKMQRRDR